MARQFDGSTNTETVTGGPVKRGRLSKSVAGSSDVTLTADEASNRFLEFTGTLTGNINVILPTADGAEWIMNNKTSGAFTLTVKTAAGTGFVIASGKAATGYCDGTNIVRATPDTP
jgi:hypothetical protein